MRVGPYEVLNELGRGGMGVVYRVRAPDGREAALKLLLKADETAFSRFERERRLLESLGEDSGFVGLLDAGRSPQGAWLVMPYVPGGTLRRRIRDAPLGVEETVALGIELATALGLAHARGIVHRDVKPENVLFSASGRALLADLGLARHFDRAAAGASQSHSLTTTGAFTGTAGYMAPEQLGGGSAVGPPADVFALGAVLYECLAGRPAFEGDSLVETLAKVDSAIAPPIGRPGVPAWLERIVSRALSPAPGVRFADGAALARALSRRDAPRRTSRALPLVAGGALGAIALAAGLLVARPTGPTAEELVRRAEARARKGDVDGELEDATRAIALSPRLAPAWSLRGSARTVRGDLDGAIADETRAIELEPSLAEAWSRRGAARSRKYDTDGAMADFTRSLELDPRVAETWHSRALMKGKKGDFEGSIVDETRALELDPRFVRALMERGAARQMRHDYEGSIADNTRAIEVDPRFPRAFVNRAVCRLRTNDRDGAIADLAKALALDPSVADAWANLGAILLEKEDWDGAIGASTGAIRVVPNHAFAFRTRGLAHRAKGEWAEEIADLARCLEISPGIPGAPELRRAIEEARAQHP